MLSGKREITALRVKCDNAGRSCKWKGSVGTLDEHVATCKFTPVPCPKECKKNGELHMIMRKDIEKHLNVQCVNRDYECKHCGKKDTYINITDLHEEVCEKKIVPCINAECTETMEQASLKKHLEKCEYTPISCRYKRLGCHMKMKRKDMEAHEQDDKAHLHQALDTVVKQQESLESATKTIALLQGKNDQGVSFTFRVRDYSKKKESNEKVFSQPFYTSDNGYNMQICVYPNGCGDGKDTHISVHMWMIKGNYDDNLNWPFVGTVKLELLNQLQDNNHYHMTASFNKEIVFLVGRSTGYSKYISHSQLSKGPARERDRYSNYLYDAQYLKDDTLYFRVTVKIPDYKPWLECTVTSYSQQV